MASYAAVHDQTLPEDDPDGFVAEFALTFTRASTADIDAAIEVWLKRVMLHLDVDRSAVANIYNKSDFLLIHSSARSGIEAMAAVASDGMFPWSCARLLDGAAVVFADVRDLPPEAAVDQESYARIGIKSHLAVPLIAGGGVLGGFAVSTTGVKRVWSPEIITRMHLLGSVLANALARQDNWRLQQRMQEQLDHLSRIGVAGEIAASLAHELTQPLAAILANAQAGLRFLARDPQATNEITAILQDIVKDNKRAAAVINGLRGLMRKRQTEREWVDLSIAAKECLAMLNMTLQSQRVTVQTRLERGAMIYANKAQIQQVLLNLLINAGEAMLGMDERNRHLSVEVRNGATVQCAVRDSGNELTSERLTSIFEPFWTTKAQGMGMGLTICRSIISAHHGAIWAEIGPRGGAIFRFDLPKEFRNVERPA